MRVITQRDAITASARQKQADLALPMASQEIFGDYMDR